MKLTKILPSKRKVSESLYANITSKHSQSQCFPLEIEIPPEAYGTVLVFRKFYHRLSFTIRRPDHLAQDLCSRGVIDEFVVVSAVFVYCLLWHVLICLSQSCNRWLHKKESV